MGREKNVFSVSCLTFFSLCKFSSASFTRQSLSVFFFNMEFQCFWRMHNCIRMLWRFPRMFLLKSCVCYIVCLPFWNWNLGKCMFSHFLFTMTFLSCITFCLGYARARRKLSESWLDCKWSQFKICCFQHHKRKKEIKK